MPITDPSQEYFKDGGWGWNGSTWVKLGMVWGYHDRMFEDLGDLNPGAGSYQKLSPLVPVGEVHVLRGISFMNNSGARGAINFRVYFGASFVFVFAVAAPAVCIPYVLNCDIVLKAGDRVWVQQVGVAAGDDLYAGVWGYKMKVT